MNIQNTQNHSIYPYSQELRGIQKQEPVAAPTSPENKPPKIAEKPAYDEYIPGKEHEPTGLYKVTHDDKGNPKIHFDDPMKKSAADNIPKAEENFSPSKPTPEIEDSSLNGEDKPTKEALPAKSEPERKAESCTTNTDKVDREIEKLKEEQKRLEQQLRATQDTQKAEDLKWQLAQVKNELQQKDNDIYRRQNAVVTQG